jgi:signal transduction histidine kinase
MPDLVILDNETRAIKQTILSRALPLGIVDDLSDSNACQHINIAPGDRILLATDGVTEARNPQGEYFGSERFKQAIHDSRGDESILDSVIKELNEFCQNAPQDDDITLAEIPLIPQLIPAWHAEKRQAAQMSFESGKTHSDMATDSIEFLITLKGSQLRQANPVPLLINYLQDTADLYKHRQPLFTILTELFVNALDHGVLNLNSNLKEGTNGINRYFEQRERRLESLSDGFIRIGVGVNSMDQGGFIVIQVEDSGQGFSLENLKRVKTDEWNYSGRGITLVENLCESIHYFTPGNRVEAVYRWYDTESIIQPAEG